jgi:hypothetical protein
MPARSPALTTSTGKVSGDRTVSAVLLTILPSFGLAGL